MLLGQDLERVQGARILGAHIATSSRVVNHTGQDRVKRGIRIAKRIQWAPLPLGTRAQLIASLVNSSALYGMCVASVPNCLLDNLRTAIMSAVWGSTRKLRCKEVVLTLFVPGHRVDPKQAVQYQALVTLKRFLNCSESSKRRGLSRVVV